MLAVNAFLQTSDMFEIACVKTFHIMFTVHVYDLIFHLGIL